MAGPMRDVAVGQLGSVLGGPQKRRPLIGYNGDAVAKFRIDQARNKLRMVSMTRSCSDSVIRLYSGRLTAD